MTKKISGYGDFGALAKKYAEARGEFPGEVISYFWELVNARDPIVLDVGCGTGISTRQLARCRATVLGLDKDPEMIRQAEKEGDSPIRYVASPVDGMPFETCKFDAVTAFSAFHWFTDKASIREIKRVLKAGGVFFVVNRNKSSLLGDYRDMLGKFIAGDLPNIKSRYDPLTILKSNGFDDVSTRAFKRRELWPLSRAAAYPRTMSLWNLIPKGKKPEAAMEIEKYCLLHLREGGVENKLEIVAVSGRSLNGT